MKTRRILTSITAILLLVVVLTFIMPDAPRSAYYSNSDRPLVIAHQGGDGVWPGDTMFAFEKCS